MKNGTLSLLEVDPNAEWYERATEYNLDDITRVAFGGSYEEALYLIAGEPKA
jgi:hypothetical protein